MVFDHWYTHMNIRDPRKAFQAISLLAYRRVFDSQEYIHNLTWTVASSCVCTAPLAVITVMEILEHFYCFQFSGVQIFPADHMHRRSGVNHKHSFLRLNFGWRMETPLFRRREERSFFLFLLKNVEKFSLPVSTLLHERKALAILSPLETDPQISWLKWQDRVNLGDRLVSCRNENGRTKSHIGTLHLSQAPDGRTTSKRRVQRLKRKTCPVTVI